MINLKKLEWNFDDVDYCIYNIPMNVNNNYGNTYDSDITLKLLILKDLIEQGEIPSVIDFKEYEADRIKAELQNERENLNSFS